MDYLDEFYQKVHLDFINKIPFDVTNYGDINFIDKIKQFLDSDNNSKKTEKFDLKVENDFKRNALYYFEMKAMEAKDIFLQKKDSKSKKNVTIILKWINSEIEPLQEFEAGQAWTELRNGIPDTSEKNPHPETFVGNDSKHFLFFEELKKEICTDNKRNYANYSFIFHKLSDDCFLTVTKHTDFMLFLEKYEIRFKYIQFKKSYSRQNDTIYKRLFSLFKLESLKQKKIVQS